MIVTIDGPAGAGKSSVAKAVAERLAFRFLDTGAMYRVVALAAIKHKTGWDDPERLAELARQIKIDFDGQRVLLDREDVTEAIRSSELTSLVRHVAGNFQIRDRLVQLQRELGRDGNIVAEGRDQGTVAFPEAECKIFLTASPEERARRRVRDLQARGESPSYDQILAQQNQRDQEDSTRAVGRLAKAEDAIVVMTDGMLLDAVVSHIEHLVRQRMAESDSDH